MADGKILFCDCGFRLGAGTEASQVAEVRRHAWEAHGISFSTEEALAVLLRMELEVAPGDLTTAGETASERRRDE